MARVRSPNYPALSLPEAISRVKTVHDAEQHLAAPKEVIAKHLGYNGLNGAALSTISAIGKYGLIEEASGAKMRVSPLAITILYPPSPADKATAIKEAAFKPALFTEIDKEWEGHRPSDENLRSYLVRRNFAVDAIDRVIKSYRETMDLVTPIPGGYTAPAPKVEPLQGLAKVGVHGQGRQTLNLALPGNTQQAINKLAETGMSQSTLQIVDERVELVAVLFDQEGLQKVIDRLTAVKGLLPEKAPQPDEMKEAAN
jgi:hypothetical protein